MACLQPQLVLEENYGAELGGVVFDVESVRLALDDGMTSAHTDVVDSNLTLMTSTKLELALGVGNSEQMNVSGGVLVEWHGLQQNVVVIGLRSDFVCEINNLEDYLSDFKSVRIHLFADFAFESLPVKGSDILVGLSQRLFLLLSKHPTLEALEVNQSYGTLTFACQDQWVGGVFLVTPADSALDVVFALVDIMDALDFHGFSELLLVQFFFRHLLMVASEVLNSESYSTQLNGVKLLNFVIVLAVFIL